MVLILSRKRRLSILMNWNEAISNPATVIASEAKQSKKRHGLLRFARNDGNTTFSPVSSFYKTIAK